MKILIGDLEITDVTKDDMDTVAELVKRFGGNAASVTKPSVPRAARSNSDDAATAMGHPQGAADTVLLKKLVEADAAGMTTDDIGTILGRRGKAAKKALNEWAGRIGLITDDNMDAFEFARVGTRRGWRLKSSLLDVARHLMGQQ